MANTYTEFPNSNIVDAKIREALTSKADKETTYTKTEVDTKIVGFVDGAEYDSTTMKILLKHGTTTIAEVDATSFIKDGMVSSVEVVGGNIVITFNTDAGLEPIEISLTDIFDPANYYDKTAADGKFVAKEAGKGLSTEDYTTAEKTKLGGIAAGAQVNVIETVKVNGTALTPQDKAVDIPVPTLDNTVTRTSANGVKSGGIWSALWGALSALPTGFTSLYDWCVSQLAGKANMSDVDPLLFARYYPDGSVKSAAEFTQGIKYDAPDTTNRTITVKPFCNTGTAANDNSNLSGRVVIPPFVDAQGNPYITDDGTRFKVVGVSDGSTYDLNTSLTAIVAPNTVTTIGKEAFSVCTSLQSVSLPAVTSIGNSAFDECNVLASVSFPAATSIGNSAFEYCAALASVSLPAATTIGESMFGGCSALASVDFGDTPRSDVPTLGTNAFGGVPTSCKIIVPYAQYDAWTAADGWRDLPQEFVRHAEKADKPATFTAGNLAALDAQGNPTDSLIPAANVAIKDDLRYALTTKTISNNAVTLDDRAINAVAVSSSLASLTVNFPTSTSGEARDFGLRLTVASGITTAPQIVLPQGVTCENADGEAPEIGADGAATILYFTETASGVFLVKGETLTAITQA